MNLEGKVAVITGGTMGIGAAIALELARRGADVALAARHRDSPAEQRQAEIQALGRRCLLLAADNIRVNCVAPGVIRTRFHADMPDERRQFNLDHRIPLHREV